MGFVDQPPKDAAFHRKAAQENYIAGTATFLMGLAGLLAVQMVRVLADNDGSVAGNVVPTMFVGFGLYFLVVAHDHRQSYRAQVATT